MPELSNLEQEISELEQILEQKKRILMDKKEAGQIETVPHDKEILSEILKEKIEAEAATLLPEKSLPKTQPLPEQPSYLSEELRPKVQELINLAFEKSIYNSIEIAKATKNAALIDAFHDALVDEVYDYLVKRKKLKKVA
ncbi:MAG: hypothetical protein ACK4NX_00765 [Candidatus Paceibacteria bacterium]